MCSDGENSGKFEGEFDSIALDIEPERRATPSEIFPPLAREQMCVQQHVVFQIHSGSDAVNHFFELPAVRIRDDQDVNVRIGSAVATCFGAKQNRTCNPLSESLMQTIHKRLNGSALIRLQARQIMRMW
jgi:hypothetical protein